ncbi:MAG: hypothetical protein BA867_06675 [Desulfobacterales bacterium S5133MH16]|nr:MAG: hypothetical protein BA867_06675 [Desulfobacterales bacterium S5133MH16]
MAENPTHKKINQKKMLPKVSLAQWQTTFDVINDAVSLLDMTGKILQCNKAMESLLKKSSKEIIGGTCQELIHGTDKPIKGCPILRMKKTLCRETLVLRIDDKWLNIAVDPVTDETGNLAGAVHIISDITRRKQAEEALRESEEKYRSLTDDVLDSSAVGIFILDSDFRVVLVNRALEDFFGLKRDEIIGKNKRQLILERIKNIFEDPDNFVNKIFAAYDDNAYIERFECHVIANGEREERWLEHRSQPVQSGLYTGGRIEHYYDITNQKQVEKKMKEMQAQLRQSQKIEAIGTLAGGVAHDFNNLLTVIMGNAELALMNVIKDEFLRKKIEEIKKAVEKAIFLARQRDG